MNLRTVVIGAVFAGGLALGYWFGTHRAQPRLAPPDSATIAGSPAISTNPSVPTQMSAAATKIVEEARAQHFEELHNVQDVFTLPSAFARREALYAIGGRADARELAALITEANNLPNPADRAAALDVLYLRYVERDAQTALQSALKVQEPQARSEALTRVGTAWGGISPEAAFQRAELEPDPAVRAILQGAILRTWALQNPEEAFSHVMALPRMGLSRNILRFNLIQPIVREFARQNPKRAMEVLTSLKSPDAVNIQPLLAMEWARNDVRAAAEWVATQPRQRFSQLAYAVAPLYAAQFTSEGLEWADRMDRGRSGNLWAQALVGLVDRDPDMALQLAMGAKDPRRRTMAISAVVGALAWQDPTLAMRYYEKVPPGNARTQIAMQLAAQLAQTEPAAAVAWLSEIPDRNARLNGFNQIGEQLAQQNVELAVELVDQVPAENRAQWIASIGNAYAQENVEAAIRWMRKNESTAGYSHLQQQFVWNLASQDPDAALEFASGISDEKQRDMVLQNGVGAVAQQSPDDAVKWIDSIRDDEMQRGAVGQLASTWVQIDPEAARKWVLSLGSSTMRDAGLSQLVAAGPVEEIEALLGQIQSPDAKMNAVFQTALRLAQEDPQAARTLLRRHPLDPQRQQNLESMLTQTYGKGLAN